MTIDGKDLSIMQMILEGNPSIHEIRKAHHWRSTGSVAHRLKRLEDLGYIRQPMVRQPRSREVTDRGRQVLKGAGITKDETLQFLRRA